jgi:spermidine synthase
MDQFGSSGFGFGLGRFLLASAILLIPCTLMGMTLPLLSRAAVASQDAVGRGVGGLYATNTLGGVAGCLAAGFALIPLLGLQQTSALAAGLNLLIGGTAVSLGRRPAAQAATDTPPRETRQAAGLGPWVVAAAFGVSGFTALGYEVLWTRALEQFTHNSTYAYTAMLATFLFGIGAGSAAAAGLADRTRRPLFWFGVVEVAIGVSVIAALLVYMRLLHWIPATVQALGGLGSWGRVIALLFGVSGITLLATTLLFGATFRSWFAPWWIRSRTWAGVWLSPTRSTRSVPSPAPSGSVSCCCRRWGSPEPSAS